MKIISKYNKKDFYDYLGFQYDTSDDIVYLRQIPTAKARGLALKNNVL